MKNKSRRKITTLLGLIPLFILLFAIVGGVTYAIANGTRVKTEHGFNVTVRGAVNVSASIKGASFFNENQTTDEVEVVVSGDRVQEVDGKTIDFSQGLNFEYEDDIAQIKFEITNTSDVASHADLIIEPNANLSEEKSNMVSTLYYSEDGETYKVQDDKYLVVHRGQTLNVILEISLTEINLPISIKGTVDFNLYSEDGLPEDFEYDKKYFVEEVGGKTVAKVEQYCPTCGGKHKDAANMKKGTYVIANDDPDSDNYAQKVLDSDINGKVVIFDGTFDEVLEIRPSKATSEVRATNDPTAEVLDPEALDLLTAYYYTRNVNNVVFTATEGTVFNNTLLCESGKISFHAQNSFYIADRIDAVKGVDSWTDNGEALAYYASINMENIKYTNMKFFGKHASIVVSDTDGKNVQYTTKDIVISNCEFNDDGATYIDNTIQKDAWGSIYVGGAHPSENIVIKNNKVDSCFQGIYVQDVVNVRIYNNEISNSQHNLIAIQSGTNTASQGKILVANNKLSNTADRAMRSLNIENANFEIKNNTFVNCGEVDGNTIELYKVNKIANSTYCFADNTFNGVAMTNIKGNESPITWIIYAD